MSAVQRKAHLDKMTISITKSLHNSSPKSKLSVPIQEVSISSIPVTTLQNIWQKAERLLNTPHAIACAPGNSSARMVASESSSRPHFVQQNAGEQD